MRGSSSLFVVKIVSTSAIAISSIALMFFHDPKDFVFFGSYMLFFGLYSVLRDNSYPVIYFRKKILEKETSNYIGKIDNVFVAVVSLIFSLFLLSQWPGSSAIYEEYLLFFLQLFSWSFYGVANKKYCRMRRCGFFIVIAYRETLALTAYFAFLFASLSLLDSVSLVLVTSHLAFLLTWSFLFSDQGIAIKRNTTTIKYEEALKDYIRHQIFYVINSLSTNVWQFMLITFAPSTAFSISNRMDRIANLPIQILILGVNSVLIPKIRRAFGSGDVRSTLNYYQNMQSAYLFIGGYSSIFCGLILPEILRNYLTDWYLFGVLELISLLLLVRAYQNPIYIFYTLISSGKGIMSYGLCDFAFRVMFSVIGLQWGYVGMISGFVFASATTSLLILYWLCKHSSFSPHEHFRVNVPAILCLVGSAMLVEISGFVDDIHFQTFFALILFISSAIAAGCFCRSYREFLIELLGNTNKLHSARE